MKYVELIFEKYSDDVYMVKCGYHKHMITVKNCDVLNTLMLFSVLAFNKFVVKYPVDAVFWKRFLNYIEKYKGIKKDIKFENVLQISLSANKKLAPRLFYSGGKDSAASHILRPDIPLIQYRVQVYKAPEVIGVETMSTNFDNELYHMDKRMEDILKLELYLPIISNYRTVFIGIEKEIWGNSLGILGYNISEFKQILAFSNVDLDSAVKFHYSYELLRILKNQEVPFEHCQATDKELANNFCYTCEKCLTYFIQGCNMEKHNFDRDKWKELYKNTGSDIYEIILNLNFSENKAEYFRSMWKIFNES